MLIRYLLALNFSLLLVDLSAQSQVNSNTSGTNVGTNNGNIYINNYPSQGTNSGAPNEKTTIPSDCRTRHYGIGYINNPTQFSVKLRCVTNQRRDPFSDIVVPAGTKNQYQIFTEGVCDCRIYYNGSQGGNKMFPVAACESQVIDIPSP